MYNNKTIIRRKGYKDFQEISISFNRPDIGSFPDGMQIQG